MSAYTLWAMQSQGSERIHLEASQNLCCSRNIYAAIFLSSCTFRTDPLGSWYLSQNDNTTIMFSTKRMQT